MSGNSGEMSPNTVEDMAFHETLIWDWADRDPTDSGQINPGLVPAPIAVTPSLPEHSPIFLNSLLAGFPGTYAPKDF